MQVLQGSDSLVVVDSILTIYKEENWKSLAKESVKIFGEEENRSKVLRFVRGEEMGPTPTVVKETAAAVSSPGTGTAGKHWWELCRMESRNVGKKTPYPLSTQT